MSSILKLRTMGMAISLLSIVTFTSCGDDGSEGTSDFDRTTLLTSLADNLIIPNLATTQSSVAAMAVTTDDFVADPTEANLNLLRGVWLEAVKDYQHTTAFGFGPGALPLGPFATVLGVFPVDEAQVEANMIDQNFNLSATFDRDVRGFFTVEYLIYGNGESDAELVVGFDQSRLDYLALIVQEIKDSFDGFIAEWNATYREEFISNDGTSAGSSVSLLYNQFVLDYENLKNFKVELPAGLIAGESPDPRAVEAYYSGISTELIQAHFESSKNIWFGRSRGGQDLIGFEEYLNEVVGGPALVVETKEAIEVIDGAIAGLPTGPLSQSVSSLEVETLRDALQENTRFFKASMSSLLGIQITFNSGDGD